MKVSKEKFKDTKLEAVNYVLSAIRYMFFENAQAYGAIIKLMLENDIDEFPLGIDDREGYSGNYSIHFLPVEDDENAVLVQLVKHEPENDENKGEAAS